MCVSVTVELEEAAVIATENKTREDTEVMAAVSAKAVGEEETGTEVACFQAGCDNAGKSAV